jgi:uncharacterized protein YdeI (YjbR/CyaY-like superfamily)
VFGVSVLDEAEVVHADDRETWRSWLAANHATARGVWLVTWRPRPRGQSVQARTGRPSLAYEEAVEEALCFGWVDSTSAKFDDDRGKQYFAPRKARSPWAATNKARVARLIADGRMTPAGLAVIEQAKANGIWEISDSVERLEIPTDLAAALEAHPGAAANFAAFPPTARKQMLWWVMEAQRPATRSARITAVAEAAAENRRARG